MDEERNEIEVHGGYKSLSDIIHTDFIWPVKENYDIFSVVDEFDIFDFHYLIYRIIKLKFNWVLWCDDMWFWIKNLIQVKS